MCVGQSESKQTTQFDFSYSWEMLVSDVSKRPGERAHTQLFARIKTTDNTFIAFWLIFIRLLFCPRPLSSCSFSSSSRGQFKSSLFPSVCYIMPLSPSGHPLYLCIRSIYFTSVLFRALNSGLAPIDWHKSLDKKDILIENELQRLRNRLFNIHTHTQADRFKKTWGTEKYT